jgi:hypothetical protein
MSFIPPRWDADLSHYLIQTSEALRAKCLVEINRDGVGSTVFTDLDTVHNLTVEVLHILIRDGDNYKWFTKLPSHEQLMKRVRHTFSSLANPSNNSARLAALLMTPKQLTLVWEPLTVEKKAAAALPPAMCFDESDTEGESEYESEPEVAESDLPPVSLKDDTKLTQEEYLLTRLRAARARVEAEQIKMQYFETTGRMPPDSESDEEDE